MTSYSNASLVAGTSHSSYVPGVWTRKTDIDPKQTISFDTIEVDAHRESPPNFSLPIRPPPIYTTYRDQQQGAPQSLEASRFSSETLAVPPPYSPRGYTTEMHSGFSSQEPPTLARMLFKYGFLFFPFWLAGIYIMRSPLLPTPDWEAGKTGEEKVQLLHLIRKTELKWAHRCLLAMFGLLLTVFLLALIVKFALLNTL